MYTHTTHPYNSVCARVPAPKRGGLDRPTYHHPLAHHAFPGAFLPADTIPHFARFWICSVGQMGGTPPPPVPTYLPLHTPFSPSMEVGLSLLWLPHTHPHHHHFHHHPHTDFFFFCTSWLFLAYTCPLWCETNSGLPATMCPTMPPLPTHH